MRIELMGFQPGATTTTTTTTTIPAESSSRDYY